MWHNYIVNYRKTTVAVFFKQLYSRSFGNEIGKRIAKYFIEIASARFDAK